MLISSRTGRAAPTRRAFLMLTAGGVAALAAGCSATDAAPSSDGSPTATGATRPGKVVTLDPFSTYNSFDLGITLSGVQEGLDAVVNPKYATTYADLPKVGTYFEPDFEAITRIGPDLILASTGQQELEPTLSKIAPTTLVTGTTSNTWRTAASEVAAALGHSSRMAALEKAYEDRAAAIKKTHADPLSSLTFVMIWQGTDKGFAIRSAASNGGQVLALAGATYIPITGTSTESETELSWEQADRIADADVICVPGATNGSVNEMSELITKQPTFQALPAAKAGRVLTLDYMTPGSYLNATLLLNEFDAFLATQG